MGAALYEFAAPAKIQQPRRVLRRLFARRFGQIHLDEPFLQQWQPSVTGGLCKLLQECRKTFREGLFF